jgi:putative transposase
MKQKQHSTEAIIRIFRQAETDETNDSVCRAHNVSKATFHRWKRKCGEMDLADAKRLKELEKENAELKKMLAESLLKNRVLEEVNAKKWYARCRRSKP